MREVEISLQYLIFCQRECLGFHNLRLTCNNLHYNIKFKLLPPPNFFSKYKCTASIFHIEINNITILQPVHLHIIYKLFMGRKDVFFKIFKILIKKNPNEIKSYLLNVSRDHGQAKGFERLCIILVRQGENISGITRLQLVFFMVLDCCFINLLKLPKFQNCYFVKVCFH